MIKRTVYTKLNHKGFTMAELLITVSILVILCGVGFVSVLSFQKSLKITEMDNTAKQIFITVQNHMTSLDTSGKWSSITEKGDVITSKPSDWDSSIEFKENSMYYIIVNDGHPTDSKWNTLLESILPYGSIDSSVKDEGSYIIEYNYAEAKVYSVFYTDGTNTLTSQDRYQISRTDKSARKNHDPIIGYYGGAVIKTLSTDVIKDNELNIEIINEEKLALRITGSGKVISAGFNPVFTVTVTGEDSEAVKKFSITGTACTDSLFSVSKEGNTTIVILDDITKLKGHFSDLFDKFYPGENIIVQVDVTSSTQLCNTVTKIASANSLFESTNTIEGTSNHEASIANVRHLQNLSDYVSKLNTNKGSNIVSAIQSQDIDFTSTTDGVYYTAANTFTGMSIYDYNNKTIAKDTFLSIYNMTLTSYEGNSKSISNLNIGLRANGASPSSGHVGLFSTIGITDSTKQTLTITNLTLDAVNINTIVENAGALVGKINNTGILIANNITIKNPTIINTYAISNSVNSNSSNRFLGGVVGQNGATSSGTVLSNIQVINPTIQIPNIYVDKAITGNVGGIIGQGGICSIINCGVYDESAAIYQQGAYNVDTNTIGSSNNLYTSQGNAGGIIGAISSSKVTIENCFASVPVITTRGNSGGVIGTVARNQSNISVSNSYSSGYTDNQEDGLYRTKTYYGVVCLSNTPIFSTLYSGFTNAGGFVGSVISNVTFNNCYSSNSVYGYYVGGFVGSERNNDQKQIKAAYNNCYTVSEIKQTSGTSGYIGAFAGYIYNSTFSNSNYVSTINDRDDSTIPAVQYYLTEPIGLTNSKYDDLKDDSMSKTTHAYARAGETYPFRTVNNTNFNGDTTTGVHYGDWTDNTPETAFSYGLVYLEDYISSGITDETGSSYGIYGTMYDENNTGTLINTLAVNHTTTKGIADSAVTYGILITKNSTYKNLKCSNRIDFNSGIDIVYKGTAYTYYAFSNASAGSSKYDSTIISFNYYNGNNYAEIKSPTIYFHPDFAAFITTSKPSIYTYQIRTSAQLDALSSFANSYSSYRNSSAVYEQTYDIYSVNSNFNSICPANNSSFTTALNGNDYTIYNLKQANTSGNVSIGLFGNIGKNGSLTDVNVSNATLSVEKNSALQFLYSSSINIGTLVSTNNGTINHCSVKNSSISINLNYSFTLFDSTDIVLGSLIGSSSESGGSSAVITNSTSEANTIQMNVSGYGFNIVSPVSGVKIGSFIGSDSNGVFSNCYSLNNSIQTDSTIKNDATFYSGGFIGYEKGTYAHTIDSCTVSNEKLDINISRLVSNTVNSSIGGFIGYSTNNNATYTNNLVESSNITVSDDSNGTDTGGFIGKQEASSTMSECSVNSNLITVKEMDRSSSIGGFIGNDVSHMNISSCYAEENIIDIDNVKQSSSSDSDGYSIGGFIGLKSASTAISDNQVTGGSITAENSYDDIYIGGFLGKNTSNSQNDNSNNTVYLGSIQTNNLDDGSSVGGFVGYFYNNAKFTRSSVKDIEIYGDELSNIGGFVGSIKNGTIYESYANTILHTNDLIISNSNIGGFIGEVTSDAGTIDIKNVYSILDNNETPSDSTNSNIGTFIGMYSHNNSYSAVDKFIQLVHAANCIHNDDGSITLESSDIFCGNNSNRNGINIFNNCNIYNTAADEDTHVRKVFAYTDLTKFSGLSDTGLWKTSEGDAIFDYPVLVNNTEPMLNRPYNAEEQPQEEFQEPATIPAVASGVAYYENNGNGYEGFYAVMDSDVSVINTLNTAKDITCNTSSYGLLIPEGTDSDTAALGISDTPVSSITFNDINYLYYPFLTQSNDSHANQTITFSNLLSNTDITYTYNEDFAASITIANPIAYQIRTDAQLRNINASNEYLSASYKQTCDIQLEDTVFTPIGNEIGFTGSYDALITEDTSYSIHNLHEEVLLDPYDGSNTVTVYSGLFSKILRTGSVSNLNVEDSIIKVTDNQGGESVVLGGITGLLTGSLNNVSYKGSIILSGTSVSTVTGGLVGNADRETEGETIYTASITKSHALINDRNVIDEYTVGLLIGNNHQATVDTCYAVQLNDDTIVQADPTEELYGVGSALNPVTSYSYNSNTVSYFTADTYPVLDPTLIPQEQSYYFNKRSIFNDFLISNL